MVEHINKEHYYYQLIKILRLLADIYTRFPLYNINFI